MRNYYAFLLFFLFYPFSTTTAQPSTSSHWVLFEAEALYRNNEFSVATTKYLQAYQDTLPCVSCLLDAIHCSSAASEPNALRFFLTKGFQLGLTVEDYYRIWPNLRTTLIIDDVLATLPIDSLIQKYLSNLDTQLIKQLAILQDRDQQYRKEGFEDDKAMLMADSINWLALNQIIDSLGRWPAYDELGLEGNDYLTTLVYHFDLRQMQKTLPYLVDGLRKKQNFMGHEVLYQLDRIGMGEGLVYSIDDLLRIYPLCKRTLMKNNLYCQAYGEWFAEMGHDQQYYHTPLDPCISIPQTDRIRNLLYLDSLQNKDHRTPWAKKVTITEFEKLVNH